jgi:5-methylcytosine-specific restriction endonuclease McrA
MVKERSQTLRKKILERDNFTCQKCKLEDKTGKVLEVHHINLLVKDGKDEFENLITLCKDCHHFAPNSKEEFDKYMQEECTGTMTTLIKSIHKVQNKLGNL